MIEGKNMTKTETTSKKGRHCIKPYILRYNAGMLRDCWFEDDAAGNMILVIRQVKTLLSEGIVIKEIRLLENEYKALAQVILESQNKLKGE